MEYNAITLYLDANNNILSFSDVTGNYPLSNQSNFQRFIHTRIIPLTPDLSYWVNVYKMNYNEFHKIKFLTFLQQNDAGIPNAAGAAKRTIIDREHPSIFLSSIVNYMDTIGKELKDMLNNYLLSLNY
jgi:hypothetical protein